MFRPQKGKRTKRTDPEVSTQPGTSAADNVTKRRKPAGGGDDAGTGPTDGGGSEIVVYVPPSNARYTKCYTGRIRTYL